MQNQGSPTATDSQEGGGRRERGGERSNLKEAGWECRLTCVGISDGDEKKEAKNRKQNFADELRTGKNIVT